jgi:hypothetical protein
MDTIYLTVGQIEALYRLSKRSQIGMELRSTASDESAVHAVSVLKDDSFGFVSVTAEGETATETPKGKPVWER